MPDRAVLDLRQLAPILPWMFILEMSPHGALQYRLAGSSLEASMGCGMTGKYYADNFSSTEQSALMEELLANALVQSCGLLRTGSFSIGESKQFALESLVLPFADARVMGGVVLVGVVKPFDMVNREFESRWGAYTNDMAAVYVVPSPRVMTHELLTPRVRKSLIRDGLELRALDIRQLVRFDGDEVLVPETPEIPSLSLEAFERPKAVH